jgi:hypothetical protein
MTTVQHRYAPEYLCTLSALFGDWFEMGHLALATTGHSFAHEGLGELYDLIVTSRFEDPTISAFELGFDERLSAVATAALAETLLWARQSMRTATDAYTFASALDEVILRGSAWDRSDGSLGDLAA